MNRPLCTCCSWFVMHSLRFLMCNETEVSLTYSNSIYIEKIQLCIVNKNTLLPMNALFPLYIRTFQHAMAWHKCFLFCCFWLLTNSLCGSKYKVIIWYANHRFHNNFHPKFPISNSNIINKLSPQKPYCFWGRKIFQWLFFCFLWL